MKIKPEHYQYMLEAIRPLAVYIPQQRAAIIAQGKAKDVEKRLRWDLFHAAKLNTWMCDNLYPYLHDEHVDTALKRIMKEIG